MDSYLGTQLGFLKKLSKLNNPAISLLGKILRKMIALSIEIFVHKYSYPYLYNSKKLGTSSLPISGNE